MKQKTGLKAIYAPSENVVAREIQGEFIIIPITSAVDEDEIFTLNETGRSIWDKMDGKKSLKEVIDCLASEFNASKTKVEKDVLGFKKELLKRKMLTEVKKR